MKEALMPKAKAVFFDAVGTLIYPRPPVEEVYACIGGKYGSTLSETETLARFRLAFRRQDELDRRMEYRTDESREHARWQAIVAEVFHDQADPSGPFAELWEHFARPDAWACYVDIEERLATLTREGRLLGIASNFDRRLRGIVAGLAPLRPIERLVISSEVGWRKPSPQFFAALVQAAGMSPSEILLMGDDVVNDIEAGRAAGLQVALLRESVND